MIYIFLIPFFLILGFALFIFWQALMLFLAAKVLGVGENSYFRSMKIILWFVLLCIPAMLVHWILKWIGFPLVEILGGSALFLLYFLIIHIFCQKYYQTGFGKNVGIFVLSMVINFFLSLVLAVVVGLPLGYLAYKNFSVPGDGSKSVFHLDKSFEDTATATLNLGSGKVKRGQKIINLRELLGLDE